MSETQIRRFTDGRSLWLPQVRLGAVVGSREHDGSEARSPVPKVQFSLINKRSR